MTFRSLRPLPLLCVCTGFLLTGCVTDSAVDPTLPADVPDPGPAVDQLDTIVSLAKRRGFVYPSSEIYGGINAVWDYGPPSQTGPGPYRQIPE